MSPLASPSMPSTFNLSPSQPNTETLFPEASPYGSPTPPSVNGVPSPFNPKGTGLPTQNGSIALMNDSDNSPPPEPSNLYLGLTTSRAPATATNDKQGGEAPAAYHITNLPSSHGYNSFSQPTTLSALFYVCLAIVVFAIAALSLVVWIRTRSYRLRPIDLKTIDMKAELKAPRRGKSRFDKFTLKSIQFGTKGKGDDIATSLRDLPAPQPVVEYGSMEAHRSGRTPDPVEADLPADHGILRFSQVSGLSLDESAQIAAANALPLGHDTDHVYAAYALDALRRGKEALPAVQLPLAQGRE